MKQMHGIGLLYNSVYVFVILLFMMKNDDEDEDDDDDDDELKNQWDRKN